MTEKTQIIEFFRNLSYEARGLEGWLGASGHPEVFERLGNIEDDPLSKVQLNQLLLLSLECGVSDDFFRYYWLDVPPHTYDLTKLEDFDPAYAGKKFIISLKHLRWGLTRIFIDGLLYFGNVKNAYNDLRAKSDKELREFFNARRIPTEIIKGRGNALGFRKIAKDDRHLISEMACKNFGEKPLTVSLLKDFLLQSYSEAKKNGIRSIKIRDLINRNFTTESESENLQMFLFSAEDILEEMITSEDDIIRKYGGIADRYSRARDAALKNTEYYLSLVNDLDVYVATSMRTRQDFRNMADTCEKIFRDPRLGELNLRYFDPTISAAEGHEDKGLIECLMVKCAKALVYSAGDKESYGKDAEAAMALSLGKPVIFYCDVEQRKKFYQDVHPLSRLINFSTGVAVGAIVTDKISDVVELLYRIFENRMEYYLEHHRDKRGYFRLREKLTDSVVRIQTNNKLLSESFWSYYISSGKMGY